MPVTFRSLSLNGLPPVASAENAISGALWLHSMPGRREKWEDFISTAKSAEIETILCLCSTEEIQEKSPSYAEALANPEKLCGITVRPFPIADYGIPADEAAYIAFVLQAAQDLRAGRKLFLHCGAGIGRTGLTASCILSALGFTPHVAEALVDLVGSGAETREQKAFLAHVRAALN